MYGREWRHGLPFLFLDKTLSKSRFPLQANVETLVPDIKYSFLKLCSTEKKSIRAFWKRKKKKCIS